MSAGQQIIRSSSLVTYSVWKALFLRESLQRLFTSRTAWLWLFLEPIIHTVFMIFIFTAVRLRTVEGIDTAVWLLIGLLSFLQFRRTATRAMTAVGANKSLFVYRQVKPIDTVLTRAFVEGFLMTVIAVILLLGADLIGLPIVPSDPLFALLAFVGMWIIGLGYGLCTSVANELVPEIGNMVNVFMLPLYLFSGVIFPLSKLPPPYSTWIMWNPLVHGIEIVRHGFSDYYHMMPGTSLSYLYGFGIVLVFAGFASHRRFERRLASL